MADLAGREIFAVGKWNGIEFDEADLDDIAANFAALGEIHKVPLKLGHNDEQKVTDGQPALGWVKNVYREGKKLLADFADVPNVIVEAIKKRLYRTVSVELLFNVDNSGKKYGHVLDAVAILGADQPAVGTLADLNMLLATRAEFSGGRKVAFTVSEGTKGNQQSEEDFDMDKKEIEELIASAVKPLDEANKALQARNDQLEKDLKLARDADEKRTQSIMQEKIAASRKAVTDLLDDAVKAKAMTPALRETYAKQIGVADDARVVTINLDEVKLMCGRVEQKKEGTRMSQQDDDDVTPDVQLLQLTRKYQADHNVADFQVAFTRISEANPKLHREYLVSNGEKQS